MDIGTVVKIKGGIGSFRGEKQVLLERISILHTTSEEATAWAESTAFRKDILDIPWTVSNGDEQLARKRAEGLDREQKAKEKRKRTREMESAVQEKLGSTEFRRVNAQKKRDRTERGKRSERIDEADYAAQKEISDQQKIKRIGEKAKRAQERSLRKQEFEKSRMHKEGIQSVVDNGKSKDRIQDNPAMMEEEKQPHESDVRIDAQMKKREQAKMRRAEERRLRELEFQRLKRSKDVGEAQRTIAAR